MGMRSNTKQHATKRNMKGSQPIEAKRTKRNITKRCKQSEMIAVELKQEEVTAKQQPILIKLVRVCSPDHVCDSTCKFIQYMFAEYLEFV